MLQVFISIALILGDGLYNFLKILYFTARSMHARAKVNKLKTGESYPGLKTEMIPKAEPMLADGYNFLGARAAGVR